MIPRTVPVRLALSTMLFVAAVSAMALAGVTESEGERITAGGRLDWVVDGDLDLIGDLWADLPFRVDSRNSVFLSIASRTSLEKPDGLTFNVRDLQYDLGLGWRGRPSWFGGKRISGFVGQRGKDAVDADGQSYARYLGFGIESRDFRAFRAAPRCAGSGCGIGGRFDWRFVIGPVIQQREVNADGILQGEANLWLASLSRPKIAFALDFGVDALIDGSDLEADFSAGPRIRIPVAGGRRASFLHYRSGGNPLGFRQPLWLLGFGYDEGRDAPPSGPGAPEIDGRVVLGRGEGRTAGQLKLRFLSPEFGAGLRGTIVIDANILTAEDTGDLFYHWVAGIEREDRASIYGAYVYHRSNHQLAEFNDRVTSVNVLELGYETLHWQRPARSRPPRSWGLIDGRARAGLLLDSSFGEHRRWYFRGGVRWSLPVRARAPLPYLLAELETGDVDRRLYAVGVNWIGALELQLEYRSDDQYFAADRRTLLAVVRYWF